MRYIGLLIMLGIYLQLRRNNDLLHLAIKVDAELYEAVGEAQRKVLSHEN